MKTQAALPKKTKHSYSQLDGVKLKESVKFVNRYSLSALTSTSITNAGTPYIHLAGKIADTFIVVCNTESSDYKPFDISPFDDDINEIKEIPYKYSRAIDPNIIYTESSTVKEEFVDSAIRITNRKKSELKNKLNKRSQETIKILNDMEKTASQKLDRNIKEWNYDQREGGFKESKYKKEDIAKCVSAMSNVYKLGAHAIYKYTIDALGAISSVITTAKSNRRLFDRLIHQLDVYGEIR